MEEEEEVEQSKEHQQWPGQAAVLSKVTVEVLLGKVTSEQRHDRFIGRTMGL